MNTEKENPAFIDASDESLVIACLGGDRQAFGKIVTRYQRMLCSVAYSSLGSLSASEEVAQEAFVEAWKKLGSLREPEKLKSWLCGILRFKISHRRRKDARQPVFEAEGSEELVNMEAEGEGVDESAMRAEEQALLWKALERVPETYREPLVLYYREHQSIEHVAYELDLSEDAVKQRLSRGRKMLQERMMSFVEDSLVRSTPGRVFTLGVLAALPALAPPAKAATGAAVAAKLGSLAKWSSVIAFVGTFSGLISSVFALRASLDQSRTERERLNVIRTVVGFLAVAAAYVGGGYLLLWLASQSYESSGYYAAGMQLLTVGATLACCGMTYRMFKYSRQLREEERLAHPECFLDERDAKTAKGREFKSRWKLFGVPLVHVRFAAAEEGDKPVFGWIAAGEQAYGLLFAWGGFVVAPVCVGIVSVGLLSVGTIGFGVLGIGMIAWGVVAFGSSAVGWNTFSALSSLGGDTAISGGFAVARDAAIGKVAFAAKANTEAAAELARLGALEASYVGVLGLIAVLVLVPVTFYAKAVRKRFGKKSG
ncbi:sigma-70 family RNA polymerase sigma factor [Pelagicoccus sp. SDUM812005]|uniref:RNA polymerase sigma factor n=1 Tax=Pelagicoccus sp. SDUM812005 TaxID=3041257 RepID=UPI00280F343E|nr:sigma-70 family RNA polymerase sigma factor [Pelagicoccus sp. SDUM812005]MDQ8180722.1 sigma-70 family RNA polymerase sigma factor [Pelagicoccus sp. SDUM812005]